MEGKIRFSFAGRSEQSLCKRQEREGAGFGTGGGRVSVLICLCLCLGVRVCKGGVWSVTLFTRTDVAWNPGSSLARSWDTRIHMRHDRMRVCARECMPVACVRALVRGCVCVSVCVGGPQGAPFTLMQMHATTHLANARLGIYDDRLGPPRVAPAGPSVCTAMR